MLILVDSIEKYVYSFLFLLVNLSSYVTPILNCDITTPAFFALVNQLYILTL